MTGQTRVLTKVVPQQSAVLSYPGIGSVIQSSRRTRPLWFDGRFLAARDMERDQQYFLRRQASFGRAAGFGVVHGLMVETVSSGGEPSDAETIVIGAGQGITPGGQLVVISSDLTIRISDLVDEENLDVQFGLSSNPTAVSRTRDGLYIVALRPVQFTANPITSYPTSLQGSPTTHDGDIVEATAVSLLPYNAPSSNFDSTSRNAAAARQIFVAGNQSTLSDALLPLAMISLQRGAIEWVDPYLVRRDAGPEFNGLRFGLPDPATQQAFLLQYDAQLQQAVNALAQQNLPAQFAATEYFQALPPAGRFPFASIDTSALTQRFFPPQTDVTLSLIPEDELPARIEDSLSLQAIDLTLAASAYADLSIFMLVPVPRANFAGFVATAQPTPLKAALQQAVTLRNPISLLRFYQGIAAVPAVETNPWTEPIGQSIYGYYIRRRSSPLLVTTGKTAAVTTLSSSGSDIAGVTLTASVFPSAATGSVTFMDGTTTLGTVALTSGVATLILQPLTPGTHSLIASYPGDANFTGNDSAPLNLTVTES